MPLERAGGQAQFIEHALPSDSPGAMTPLLTWMEQHLSRELPLQVIAVRATPGCARMCLHSVREENRAWSAGPLRQAGSGWPRSDLHGRGRAALEIARPDQHREAIRRELLCDVTANALIGPRDQGDACVWHSVLFTLRG